MPGYQSQNPNFEGNIAVSFLSFSGNKLDQDSFFNCPHEFGHFRNAKLANMVTWSETNQKNGKWSTRNTCCVNWINRNCVTSHYRTDGFTRDMACWNQKSQAKALDYISMDSCIAFISWNNSWSSAGCRRRYSTPSKTITPFYFYWGISLKFIQFLSSLSNHI